MKFRNMIILLFLSIIFTSNAQTHFESNVQIGGKAGVTLSKVSFTPSVPQTWLIGEMMGVTLKYTEEKHFGLIVEVNFEKRGWKETFDGTSYKYQRELSYIQIPLLTHIYFGSHKFRGFFNLGPELGFMIANSAKANFDVNDIENLPDFPIKYRRTEQLTMAIQNKIDYGISAGGGIECNLQKKHLLSLEARFYFGLGNIYKNKKTDIFAGSSNMSLMLTLGYSFRIK